MRPKNRNRPLTQRRLILVLIVVCFAFLSVPAFAQHGFPRITRQIDEKARVTLHGDVRPEAKAANDRGAVDDSLPLDHMMLQLSRSPEQEKALQTFLDQLHDKNSPYYHKWLTAREFGEKYGVDQDDINTITGWLASRGFTVNGTYANHMVIDFSGTAGQVRESFDCEIHNLDVHGAKHIANMSNPRIPEALATAVTGIVSLNDFRPKPMHVPVSNYTTGGGRLVAPPDLATIYNFQPIFAAGYSGQGQTIVVIEDTNVYSTSDWSTFRSTFGLSTAYPGGSFTQVHPGKAGTGAFVSRCNDPGFNADDGEAILDAEWSSAAAPSAAIVLASCANTKTLFGGFIAMQNLLNGGGTPPSIISVSYGDSETDIGEAFNQAINSLYQQAASMGVSVFVSTGDWLAACSDIGANEASYGINVNGLASTPYNVAVGGTDFGDTYEGTAGTYWNSTNNAYYGSAKSYVPEIPWNNSCANTLLANYQGYGQTYGTSGFCNNTTSYINIVGASGGPSACATGTPSVAKVVGGTCQGYSKPSWQSVSGNPNDGVRDLPDVSLFAANGVWGHYYVVCYSDTANGGKSCGGAPNTWWGGGGTSFAAPIMAGVQALVNQYTGSAWGNPNYHYYTLAAGEYGASGNASCDSTNGNGPASDCIFHDVTLGNIDSPCAPGAPNCYAPAGSYGVLSTSTSSYQPAYAADSGWDFATGLGTVNVYNLVKNFNAPPGPPTDVTVSAGAGQATVSFTAPLSNGGNVITSYTVTAYLVGSGAVAATATGASSPIAVTGLTGGVSYYFTVSASSSYGVGLASAASNDVTVAPIVASTPAIGPLGYLVLIIALGSLLALRRRHSLAGRFEKR